MDEESQRDEIFGMKNDKTKSRKNSIEYGER